MNPIRDPEYKLQWVCSECGSSDVMIMDDAWFDPNDGYEFIGAVECGGSMDWCNDCNGETSFDEAIPPDDPWGHAYGDPMYWVPPTDDKYWDEKGSHDTWTVHDEQKYWAERLG